jgi:hypothetical protein
VNKLKVIQIKESANEVPRFTQFLIVGLSTWFAVLTVAAVVLLVVVYKRLHRKDDMKRPLTANSGTDEEAAIDDLVEQLAEQVVDMDAKSTTGRISPTYSDQGPSSPASLEGHPKVHRNVSENC